MLFFSLEYYVKCVLFPVLYPEACDIRLPLLGDTNLDQLVKMLFGFFDGMMIIFPFVISNLRGGYFETVNILFLFRVSPPPRPSIY